MTIREPLLLLVLLLSARVLPQLLVRLFARAYPPDDPRAKEMIGEVYAIRPRRRLGWALEQAERAWFEGRAAHKLVREERKEGKAGLAVSERLVLLEECRRQDEAEFDAFLRGILPAPASRHAKPRRRGATVAPAVLLTSTAVGFAGLAAVGPAEGEAQFPPSVLVADAVAFLHSTLAVGTAVLLLMIVIATHASKGRFTPRHADLRRPHRQRGRPAVVRFARTAIAVAVDHDGGTFEGLAIAWGRDRVLVASTAGRSWTPATRVRRVPAI